MYFCLWTVGSSLRRRLCRCLVPHLSRMMRYGWGRHGVMGEVSNLWVGLWQPQWWVKSTMFEYWQWNGLRTVPNFPLLDTLFGERSWVAHTFDYHCNFYLSADWHEDGLLAAMWHEQKLASKKSGISTEIGQQTQLRVQMRRTETQNVMMLQMLGIQMATQFHETGLGSLCFLRRNKGRDISHIHIDLIQFI